MYSLGMDTFELIQFLCLQRFIGKLLCGVYRCCVGARIGSGGWFNCFLCMPSPILSFHTYLYCYFIPTCDPLCGGNMLLGHNLPCKDVFSGSKIVYECYEHWDWIMLCYFWVLCKWKECVLVRSSGPQRRKHLHRNWESLQFIFENTSSSASFFAKQKVSNLSLKTMAALRRSLLICSIK
jgi:hypothetical protein